MTQDFFTLSQVLTGDGQLNAGFAEAVLAGVAEGRKAQVDQLLRLWSAAPSAIDPEHWIAQYIWSDPALRSLCQDIILSWNFGGLFRDGQAQPVTEVDDSTRAALWFAGSFWRLAKTHPPGLPGGYFGHWSYPGEA